MMLTLLGIMVAGVFFLAVADLRQGLGSLLSRRAFNAAESGAARLEGQLGPGGAPAQDLIGQLGGAEFSARLIPLGSGFAFIRSTGTDGSGRARQEVGRLIEYRRASLEPRRAALTVLGEISGRSGTLVSSTFTPFGESCESDKDSIAGLLVASLDDILIAPCQGCFSGTPAVSVDSTLTSVVGRSTLDQLLRLADHRLPDGGTLGALRPSYTPDGSCDESDLRNWGDPTPRGFCSGFFPVVYARGDLSVLGGWGQGILVVEGDLRVSRGFRFQGLIIVLGRLSVGESGAEITGQVIAGSVGFPQSSGFSRPFVVFSTCAVEMTLDRHLMPYPLQQRSWFGLN